MEIQGWPAFKIKKKLKILDKVKKWNKEIFGCVKEKKSGFACKIQELDRMEERETLSEDLQRKRKSYYGRRFYGSEKPSLSG